MLLDDVNNSDPAQEEAFRIFRDTAWSKCPPWHTLAVPQLGSCASSGRAWRLWAARHSQEEAGPLGTQPLPRLLEPATSKVADFTAVGHSGLAPRAGLPSPEARRRGRLLTVGY